MCFEMKVVGWCRFDLVFCVMFCNWWCSFCRFCRWWVGTRFRERGRNRSNVYCIWIGVWCMWRCFFFCSDNFLDMFFCFWVCWCFWLIYWWIWRDSRRESCVNFFLNVSYCERVLDCLIVCVIWCCCLWNFVWLCFFWWWWLFCVVFFEYLLMCGCAKTTFCVSGRFFAFWDIRWF